MPQRFSGCRVSVSLRFLLRDYFSSHDLAGSTERAYGVVVNVFERWHGKPATVADLAAAANDYLRIRLDGGTLGTEPCRGNRHTAQGHRAVIGILLRFAVRKKWLRRFDLRPIKKRAHVPHALLPEELSRMVAKATPMQRAAILLALDTGFRRSDLFAVTWQQAAIRDGGWVCWVVTKKTGKLEVRRLRPETVAALEAVRSATDNRLLPRTSRNYTIWRRGWIKLGQRAGVNVDKRGLQAVRRCGASLIQAAGHDAKRYLGHSSDGVAQRYYLDPRICSDIPDLPPPISEPDDAA